jgi:methyl-accepting chemotaxis protein
MGRAAWWIAVFLSLATALSAWGSLATARQMSEKVKLSQDLIRESNRLNQATRESLDPTVEMNENAGKVALLIEDTLASSEKMKEDLQAMLATVEENNLILAELGNNTEQISGKLGSLLSSIKRLAMEIEKGNAASAGALSILKEIADLNRAIVDQMAQIDAKISTSLTYRIFFTAIMPTLP